MLYFQVFHTHRHGSDTWVVKTQSDNPLPTGWFCEDSENESEEELKDLAKRLSKAGIDFEPDRGETLDIHSYDLNQKIVEV